MAAALLSALAEGRSLVLRDDGAGGLVLVVASRSGATATHAVAGDAVGAAWGGDGAVLFGRLAPGTRFVDVEPDTPGADSARVHLADGVWLAILPATAAAVVVFHDAGGAETGRHRVEPPA